ncbi:Nucleotide-binding universal stress protein, UspA family [Pilibacter termitis]|uniref:Universal stress protein n=1 Tax=Pilibacter termitis TaxID=263852 RepID=A0A1T4MYV1_9ENTE|nr:universal stress protein [Pilibacter termitis]SJZ72034.1 Nucleotide-binding universal stress protein, UspA family [Pilibacter termitis]
MEQRYNTILVGLDGSPQANHAFECAVEVARRNDARLIAVSIIQHQMYDLLGYGNISHNALTHEAKEFTELLEEVKVWAKSIDFPNVETEVIYGNPKELLAHTLPKKYGVDLIMVGQSGLNTIERFMVGSVSDFVIRNAPCDVLVVAEEVVK